MTTAIRIQKERDYKDSYDLRIETTKKLSESEFRRIARIGKALSDIFDEHINRPKETKEVVK
jgi:hypothetical protein